MAVLNTDLTYAACHCKMKMSVRWTYKNYAPDLTPGTGSMDRQVQVRSVLRTAIFIYQIVCHNDIT